METSTQSNGKARPKELRGYGLFKGKLGGSEELARKKQDELEREDGYYSYSISVREDGRRVGA
jgi:hypothetical protein